MSYPPDWQKENGHAFQEGAALGQLLAHVLEIKEHLHDLPEKVAERMGDKRPGISIQLRDLPGIILGIGAVIAAASGKFALAVSLLEKVSGGP